MSGFTELLLWVHQLKSHLLSSLTSLIQLSSLQSDVVNLVSLITLSYLLILVHKPTAARLKISAAFFLCVVISYSPLYDLLSNVQFYSLYSMVYLYAAKCVTNKKIKYTLVIMSVFEFLMAYDRYVNAGTATWLYDSFEEITCLIHALIISSSIKLKPINWRDLVGRLIDSMRSISHSYCLTSRL